MTTPFILIYDGLIVFNLHIKVTTALDGFKLPIESFLSEYGLLLPLNNSSLLPFSITGKLLSNPTSNTALITAIKDTFSKNDRSAACIILDPNHTLYLTAEYQFNEMSPNHLSFHASALPITSPSRMIFSVSVEHHDVALAALECTNSLYDALSLIFKIVPTVQESGYTIFKIDELCEWIKSCLHDKQIHPFNGQFEVFDQSVSISS